MFSRASVILFTGGGMHGRGACMAGGMCGIRACVAGDMVTAAVGMHPTGMHSCFVCICVTIGTMLNLMQFYADSNIETDG